MAELFRLRICFAKVGRLRWLSHLELTRALERLIRRSGLPYATSQGFNPHMRLASGPALPVGTAGVRELLDVWLTRYVAPSQALAMLIAAAGALIPIWAAEYVPTTVPGLQATHTWHDYQLILDWSQSSLAELRQSLADWLYRDLLISVDHKGSPKQFTLAEVLGGQLQLLPAPEWGADSYQLRCTLRSTARGSLRPEQLVAAWLGPNSQKMLQFIQREAMHPEPENQTQDSEVEFKILL
ncbi:MAG: TIGR03936 family radical SAM-associated protein [Actinomycetia bacterium]|nr:TIGR03936 family radical SAM-associated protein [Actinomycetes bacterium]